jgi:hypothetical protein
MSTAEAPAAPRRRLVARSSGSLAGPAMLFDGLLITASQLLLWPLRGRAIIATLTLPIYRPAMSTYLVAVWVLPGRFLLSGKGRAAAAAERQAR